MTIQVGPFSALNRPLTFLSRRHKTCSLWLCFKMVCSLHPYLTTPLCSGIFGCWVDVPARKQVEPLRLAQRTLTKSLGPTTLPGVSADTSWVTIVSWPIFCRICRKPLHRIQTWTWFTCVVVLVQLFFFFFTFELSSPWPLLHLGSILPFAPCCQPAHGRGCQAAGPTWPPAWRPCQCQATSCSILCLRSPELKNKQTFVPTSVLLVKLQQKKIEWQQLKKTL